MKLETGMYVRTRWGIAKITEISGEIIYIDRCFQPIDETKIFKEDIIKASYNIIDLIEVGDYVNGEKITEISESGNVLFYQDYDKTRSIENNSIKSIATKEQFKEIEYKVEENNV